MTDTSQTTAQVKAVMDIVAVGGIVSTIIGWLPSLAAAVSLVWLLIQIWESVTLQGYLTRRRARRREHKLRRLLAKQKLIQAEILAADAITQAKVEAVKIVERAKTSAALTQTLDAAVDAHNS